MNVQIDTLAFLQAAAAPVLVPRHEVTVLATAVLGVLPTETVRAAGHVAPFAWAGAAGTTSVELDPVLLSVAGTADRSFAGFPLGQLPASVPSGSVVVTVPAGRRVRALHLADLRTLAEPPVELTDDGTLDGLRLSVSTPAPGGGWLSPVVSVPHVNARGQVPATLTGGSFSGSVLRLPDVAGSKLRISVVTGASPEEFAVVPVEVGTVTGWAAPTPRDLELVGPDGTVLWAFPGELLPGTRLDADVSVPVRAAVQAMLDGGAPLAGSVTLRGAHECRLGLRLTPVTGALLRTIPGTRVAALAGEAVVLALPGPPAGGAPSSVVADLHVRYEGLRLADVSDPLPPPGATSGLVVRAAPVYRVLPEAALRGEQVQRLGLVGHCPEPASLVVRLVPARAAHAEAGPQAGLGPPAVVSLPASASAAVVWVDLPEPVTVTEAAAVEVSAGQGRFLWAADGVGRPLVRIAVVDPDPGNRPVLVGPAGAAPATLLTVLESEVSVTRAALPPSAFSTTAVVLASSLFARVEISDLELRHRRGV